MVVFKVKSILQKIKSALDKTPDHAGHVHMTHMIDQMWRDFFADKKESAPTPAAAYILSPLSVCNASLASLLLVGRPHRTLWRLLWRSLRLLLLRSW